MAEESATGRVVGERYKITAFQRAGRMGDVYVGRRLDTNERVSVKLMDAAMFQEKEAVARFERESKILVQLENPCTLAVHASGRTADGLPWMALEYVEGDTLADVIEQGPLPAERAAYIAAQIAMALAEAHGLGIVHRDLAPANVLITDVADQADSVKVLDFGLSRLQDSGESGGTALTEVGVRIGSPAYMAPEYIEDFALDPRADLYALGILLFEMVTGAPPFVGRPYKIMDQHLNAQAPAPSTVAEGVPAWFDALVAALLKKNPDERIQTAQEVVSAIENGLQVRLQTVTTVAPSPTVEVYAPPEPEPAAARVPQDTEGPLDRFVKAQVREVKRGTGALDPHVSYRVAEVAGTCVAAALGVTPGWLVSLPDDPTVGVRETRLWMHPAGDRRYVFASPDGSERLEVLATGVDPGMELIRTTEHVRRYYQPLQSEPEALLDVWRQGDWALLEQLSWRTISQQRGSAGLFTGGLLGRFLGQGSIKVRNHPALLMYGAAKIEQGAPDEGMPLVAEYLDEHAGGWSPRFEAVATFYRAQQREKSGDLEGAGALYVQSWLAWPNPRTWKEVVRMTHYAPDTRVWYGRQFPDYTLEDMSRPGVTVQLYDRLARMAPHQVLLVCMMGGFRGNPVYDQFMRRHLGMSAHLAQFFGGLHVVTHRTVRDADRPEHYVGEDLLVGARVDVAILEDYRAFVQRAVKPSRIPTIYALDCDGWVVHEGAFGTVEVWEALSRAGHARRAAGG